MTKFSLPGVDFLSKTLTVLQAENPSGMIKARTYPNLNEPDSILICARINPTKTKLVA